MDNILNYTRTNLKTFEEEAFNEVDSVIFSWISYLSFPIEFSKIREYEGMLFKDVYCAEYFEEMLKTVRSGEDTILLLSLIACSPRFRNVRLFRYEEELNPAFDEQFAAISYEFLPGKFYVAFRGTDSSFAGWREDWNLTYMYPVPAQKRAANYLAEIGDYIKRYKEILTNQTPAIRVGGHSKGGNLAIYAALNCPSVTKDLVTQIYSHDGPGFMPEIVYGDEYQSIKHLIHKTMPTSSFFGMMLFQDENPKIIVSHGISIGQHNPFTWKVNGYEFEEAEKLTANAWLSKAAFNDWVLSQTPEERKCFADTFFDVLENSDAENFEDFGSNLKITVPAAAQVVKSHDKETKRAFLKTLGLLAKSGVKSIPEVISQELRDIFNR